MQLVDPNIQPLTRSQEQSKSSIQDTCHEDAKPRRGLISWLRRHLIPTDEELERIAHAHAIARHYPF